MKTEFSRRAQRKQDRLDKKQKKNQYFQKRKGLPISNANDNKPKVSFSGWYFYLVCVLIYIQLLIGICILLDDANAENYKKKRIRKRSVNSDGKPKKSRFEIERDQRFIRDEEKNIKRYEKLLKLKPYKKRNRIPKSFYLEGLGELMELCDGKKYDNRLVMDEDEKGDLQYLKQKRSKAQQVNVKSKKAKENDGSDQEDEGSDFSDVDNEDMGDETNSDDVHSEGDDQLDSEQGEDDSVDGQEDGDLDDEEMDGEDEEDFEDEEEDEDCGDEVSEQIKLSKKNQKLNAKGYYEDIYGFLRDKDGNIVKNEQDNGTSKLDLLNSNVVVEETLQRKLRGLLNRLTADNIKVISREIIDLYKSNSRAVINKGILNCVEKVIFAVDYTVPAKLVSEISMLVVILFTEIGEEVGAFFLHSAICHFDTLFGDSKQWNSSKKLDNVVVLLLNLYATGLVDSAIIYDILDKFCDQFTQEKSIEIIDLILKTSGFLLRKDDASKMKSLIMNIQRLSTSVDLGGLSGSRIKFILESLTAIKNNNVAKLKVSEPVVLGELIEHTLKGVLKKGRVACIPGQYATVIQSAHWFSYTKTIVPLDVINPKIDAKQDESATAASILDDQEQNIDYALRDQLCKALRINTPLRKDLFSAMFQCNDYLDAACKLISIGKKQFSEVINVVLHVAIKEKVYNHFYYHLLQHLSTCDRKYKVR